MEINNTHINASALGIHGKLRAMQKQKGFCWAPNETLANLFGLSKSYISHQLTALERAGLIYRHMELDDKGAIACRQIVAFREATETAVAKADFERLVADKTEAGVRNRLIANAKNLSIAPTAVIRAIIKYGADNVDVALAIVKASNTCISPVSMFFAALIGGWHAGKRAAGYIGTLYTDAKRRTVMIPKYTVDELTRPEIADEYKDLTPKEMVARLRAKVQAQA